MGRKNGESRTGKKPQQPQHEKMKSLGGNQHIPNMAPKPKKKGGLTDFA